MSRRRPNPPGEPKPARESAPSVLDRVLPHSLDAERAVLGSMLQDPSAIGVAISVLSRAGGPAFFFEKHQRLYDHLVELYDQNRPIDGVVIQQELARKGAFEELGGYAFLGELVSAVPSATRAREYATIVLEKALLRQVVGAAQRVMDRALEDRAAAQEILDEAEREIFAVTERRVSGGLKLLPELIDQVFERIQDMDGRILTGVSTGFAELDDLTCGFQPGELIIVAGRPSMGKTALGLNIAEHVALNEGKPVLFFSLEMSDQQLAQRILCSRASVDAHALRRGRHSHAELQRLQQAAGEIRDKPLLIDDTSDLSILELRARARMAYRRCEREGRPLAVVFVDYLQLMRTPQAETRQVEVAEISRGLKALAKELNIPVVAMAQLNRNPEDKSRRGNRPRMSDLRESGAIEQDADVILLLHRESYYRDPSGDEQPTIDSDDTAAELIIAKQRNGPVGTIELHFDRRYTRFADRSDPTRYRELPEAYAADTGFP